MNETDYWVHLEFRICRELETIPECRRQGLWCDGLIPDQYELASTFPYIGGRVWIGIGPREQQLWTFKLHLLQSVDSSEQINWATLLPSEDITSWLGVDEDEKHLDIEPGVAIRPFT